MPLGSCRRRNLVGMPTTRCKWIARTIAPVVITLICCTALLAQNRPIPVVVDHVEPSNLHRGASEEVVLRLSGEQLDKVVGVKVKHKGVRVVRMDLQDDGHLLVTLRISRKAEPGTLMLQVFTRYMTTFAALPFEQPSAPSVRGELSAAK